MLKFIYGRGWDPDNISTNNIYYIHIKINYWLLSPHFWNGGDARINAIHSLGQMGFSGSLGESGVR